MLVLLSKEISHSPELSSQPHFRIQGGGSIKSMTHGERTHGQESHRQELHRQESHGQESDGQESFLILEDTIVYCLPRIPLTPCRRPVVLVPGSANYITETGQTKLTAGQAANCHSRAES